jgi:hypothetical protein
MQFERMKRTVEAMVEEGHTFKKSKEVSRQDSLEKKMSHS